MPRNNKFLAGISLVITAIFLLAGCGTPLPSSVGGLLTGQTVTSITPTTTGTLMGGAKQGVPLVLSASVTLFAGSTATFAIVDATGAAAGFKNPVGITTDGANLYVADPTANNIRKIVIASASVTTIAGSMTGVVGSNDATGTAAGFNGPRGVTTDGTNLYVADTGNNLIRKIVISTGVVTTLAGSTSVPAGFADGVGTSATFNAPYGITTDGTSLYVTDLNSDTIRKIDIATGTVSTLAGSATLPAGYLDSTGTAALFNAPRGITTDGINLYVADTGNNRIRQIVISTAVVTTTAGTGGVGTLDGPGTTANFTGPAGITMDGTNLYISDTGNHTIRKIVISTSVVTTLAGTAGTSGAIDGVGTAATFWSPYGITTDGISLYVAEWGNGIIRKIQ